jgi:hypothetical protein
MVERSGHCRNGVSFGRPPEGDDPADPAHELRL